MKNKAKICIITARNIYDSPCLEKYERLIRQSCDIIYWDRHDIEEKCFADRQFKYTGIIAPGEGMSKKIRHYVKFSRYVKKVIKSNEYECLIVFPSHTAWLILDVLTRKYKNKYILDIRDYSGENNRFIKFLTEKAINSSGFCSITSKAYERFLPEHDYVVSHNIQQIDKSLIYDYRNKKKNDDKIVLSFIGTIRFIDQQKKIIEQFRNDNRFILQYIGRGSEQLEDYCRSKEVRNVVLKGRFERSELSKYYLETDVAINIYGNNNPFLDYALSNKLYSAALMGMPILCSPNTYMSEISEKYEFGYSVDLDSKSCADDVYNYYIGIDREKLHLGCDRFISSVNNEEEIYANRLCDFLRKFNS